MTQPIGYFTSDPQAAALVEKFGDYELEKLPQTDQAALLTILSAAVYLDSAGHSLDLEAIAEQVIPEDLDFTSDAITDALDILQGIAPLEALNLIAFIVQ